jgi:hypothetical protein
VVEAPFQKPQAAVGGLTVERALTNVYAGNEAHQIGLVQRRHRLLFAGTHGTKLPNMAWYAIADSSESSGLQ